MVALNESFKNNFLYRISTPLKKRTNVNEFIADLKKMLDTFHVIELSDIQFKMVKALFNVTEQTIIYNYYYLPLVKEGNNALNKYKKPLFAYTYSITGIYKKDDDYYVNVLNKRNLTNQLISLGHLRRIMNKHTTPYWMTRTLNSCISLMK